MSEGGPRPVSLLRRPRGARVAIVKGQDAGRFMDFYHDVLTASWPGFVVRLAALFLVVNLVFAILYVTDRGGIANARPGSFADAFFFSVQTMATIGYGRMVPISNAANILVTIEAGLGLFGMAVAASLLFARFTRATAGVRFSRNAVITMFDGKPTFMFRIGYPIRPALASPRREPRRWSTPSGTTSGSTPTRTQSATAVSPRT